MVGKDSQEPGPANRYMRAIGACKMLRWKSKRQRWKKELDCRKGELKA